LIGDTPTLAKVEALWSCMQRHRFQHEAAQVVQRLLG